MAEKKAATQKALARKIEYKVIGEKFKKKENANEKLQEIAKKGFKSAGLMVQGDEFAVLYGTYATEKTAKANVAAITDAGFKAEIMECPLS